MSYAGFFLYKSHPSREAGDGRARGREGERERETARGDRTKENPDMSSATEFYSEILLKTVKSVDCSF